MNIKNIFKDYFKEKVLFNEPMSKHTTFKTGGPADIFVMPNSVQDILKAIQICTENNIDYYIVGRGSNILVSDKGFRGAVIQIYKNFSDIKIEADNSIYAQSGALLSKTAEEALNNNLSGMEFASGIPGCIGGAVCMNAGAYGGEMKDIIEYVDIIKDNNISRLQNREACFEYRSSAILKNNMIVLGAKFILNEGSFDNIKHKMEELNRQRREKQPLEFPSAGSTFKRPEGYFAGKLIMDSGLKGYTVGGAAVSEKHCGFVINKGGASASDIIKLIDDVKNIVYEKFNVKLEPEIRIIGEF